MNLRTILVPIKIIFWMIIGALLGALLFKSMETYTYIWGILVGMTICQTVAKE